MLKNNFFDITSVVVVGATLSEGKIGNEILKNLVNFSGKKYGINPKGGSFSGIDFYKSYTNLPEIPDLAVFVIPADFVEASFTEAAKFGIKRVIIISAGFKEIGNTQVENRISKLADKYGISVLGPNCLGYVDPLKNLNVSFGGKDVLKGNIAMISQSGAMAVVLMDWAFGEKLGFSKIISMGNKSDVSEVELLEELENDENTQVIVMYLESIEAGKKFHEIAKRVAKKKPIVLLKSGSSDRGQKAASSHTGALAGEAVLFDMAFSDAGIHSTSRLEELLFWTKTFSKIPNIDIPDELMIITNAGGPGVITIDHAEKNKIQLFSPSQDEIEILMQNLPQSSSVRNPVDIIGDADSSRYGQILDNFVQLNREISLLILLTPQAVTDCENIAHRIGEFKKHNPDIFIMTSFMGGASVYNSIDILNQYGVLYFDYPAEAIKTYKEILDQKISIKEVISHIESDSGVDQMEIQRHLKKERKLCSIETTNYILEKYNIRTNTEILISETSDLPGIFTGTPLIAKVSSPDIAHKTDVGGIISNINSQSEAVEAFNKIIKNVSELQPGACISGVSFQEIVANSREIFVGLKRDVIFGDILILGMGGIYVNVYEDVNRALLPVSKSKIIEMLMKLRGSDILKGIRGEDPINFEVLAETVQRITQLFSECRSIREIDINPILVNRHESIVVDAKLYL